MDKHAAANNRDVTGKRSNGTVIDAVREQRIRAAWLYYIDGHNQQEVATVLGITRLQVTRLLADARKRGEINIRINSDLEPIVAVQRRIETRFNVSRVIVAPRSDPATDPVKPIAVAAGRFISGYVQSGMNIGVGWGRTLYSSLPHIEGSNLEDIRVVSLLGGIAEAAGVWIVIQTWNYLLPASPLPIQPEGFLFHYSVVWVSTFLFSQGPMRVLHPRWRFYGGEFWVSES